MYEHALSRKTIAAHEKQVIRQEEAQTCASWWRKTRGPQASQFSCNWRSHRWLSESHFKSTSLSYPYAPFLQVFVKKKERKSAINGFRLCINKLLTWVSGLPRSTVTSIHPFVQYAKVTLLEISPCQCPTVKRSGVAYSCSYALLVWRVQRLWQIARTPAFPREMPTNRLATFRQVPSSFSTLSPA